MWSNRFAFAALATACVAAAGVGGYLATRSNATPAASPAAAAAAPIAGSPAAIKPVQETEAVVGDEGARGGKGDSTPKIPSAPTTPAAPAATTSSAPRGTTTRTVATRAAATATAVKSGTLHQDPPPVDRTWPTSPTSPQGIAPAPPPAVAPPSAGESPASLSSTTRPDDRSSDAARASEPPEKVYEELVIAPDSVLGLQFERTISTATARVEDRVDARVTRDVRVGEKIAIPSGARAIGSVTEVDRGGKFKERARLGIRFHTLLLADGTRMPMSTETIYRDGDPPVAAQKMGGGAVAGAILGAILGGAKGAAIGGATGAGAGAAAAAAGDRSAATFPAGTQTTVRILSPVTITVER
jgi:hypothetical protein